MIAGDLYAIEKSMLDLIESEARDTSSAKELRCTSGFDLMRGAMSSRTEASQRGIMNVPRVGARLERGATHPWLSMDRAMVWLFSTLTHLFPSLGASVAPTEIVATQELTRSSPEFGRRARSHSDYRPRGEVVTTSILARDPE